MTRELLELKERIIYEDDIAVAVLPPNAAAKGHITIIPKKEIKYIEELSEDELEHLFYLSSYTATVLFETLGMHGTNIITYEGDEFYLEVIGRKQDDGLNFQWKPKQLPTGEMDSVLSSISGKIILGGETKQEDKPAEEPSHPPRIEDQASDKKDKIEDDYMIKQLQRIP